MEKSHCANNKHEKAGAVLISDKTDFETKAPFIRKTESP